MKKLAFILCLTGLCMFGMGEMPVNAAEEIDEVCTETVEEERAEGLVKDHYVSVSNYYGSLCISAYTQAIENMEVIGLKDVTAQYSYDGVTWYDEWNAGDFVTEGSNEYSLTNYIMSVERSGCYYRISCKHYAKKGFLNSQSIPAVSNSVWIS